MTAIKAKVNDKNIIVILIGTVIVLVALAFNGNAKLASVVENNEDINKNLETLNANLTQTGQKTLAAISEIGKQRAELEELRKKLTQERLKNVQLQGEMEKMSSEFSSAPASVSTPAPVVPETAVN